MAVRNVSSTFISVLNQSQINLQNYCVYNDHVISVSCILPLITPNLFLCAGIKNIEFHCFGEPCHVL